MVNDNVLTTAEVNVDAGVDAFDGVALRRGFDRSVAAWVGGFDAEPAEDWLSLEVVDWIPDAG